MEQQEKKNSKGKYILIGLGVVAVAGTALFFATRKPKTSFVTDAINDSFEADTIKPSRTGTGSGSGSKSSGFPLKKGSRGDLVKNVQEALIAKYGSGILPRYGADGQWGSEMQTALVAKGLPTTISADDFTKIITSGGITATSKPSTSDSKFNPTQLAKNLRVAIIDDDLSQALNSLSKIRTTKGYTMVNDEFKEKRINGVRKTIVNALLTKFWQKSEKKKLNAHFYRMGLKYNGSQWSLSGIGQILCDQIKSIQDTSVWNANGNRITVPENTILGEFIDARNDVTKFKTLDNKILFTSTKCICYV